MWFTRLFLPWLNIFVVWRRNTHCTLHKRDILTNCLFSAFKHTNKHCHKYWHCSCTLYQANVLSAPPDHSSWQCQIFHRLLWLKNNRDTKKSDSESGICDHEVCFGRGQHASLMLATLAWLATLAADIEYCVRDTREAWSSTYLLLWFSGQLQLHCVSRNVSCASLRRLTSCQCVKVHDTLSHQSHRRQATLNQCVCAVAHWPYKPNKGLPVTPSYVPHNVSSTRQ